jgi:hypothetical protein
MPPETLPSSHQICCMACRAMVSSFALLGYIKFVVVGLSEFREYRSRAFGTPINQTEAFSERRCEVCSSTEYIEVSPIAAMARTT